MEGIRAEGVAVDANLRLVHMFDRLVPFPRFVQLLIRSTQACPRVKLAHPTSTYSYIYICTHVSGYSLLGSRDGSFSKYYKEIVLVVPKHTSRHLCKGPSEIMLLRVLGTWEGLRYAWPRDYTLINSSAN